jgi:uncharacterized protein
MEDLKPGMKLPGIVTNVTAFGAFVDVGVHQDGLVHISQLSDSFVKNPADMVKVQQRVQVTVVEVDIERKRIALSMKAQPDLSGGRPRSQAAPRSSRSAGSGSGRQEPSRAGRSDTGLNSDWFTQALNKKG